MKFVTGSATAHMSWLIASRRGDPRGSQPAQSVADAFCDKWAHPADMWRAIATPDRAAAFLAAAGAPAMPIAA
ncbi:MAG: hypothetical protein QOI48_3066 [Solirubrobacteraceae bacterium]|nr:hypothetical protein [Solirubrobacteraceae bacterium]